MRGMTLAAVTTFAIAALCAEIPKPADPKISAIYPVVARAGQSFAALIRGTDLGDPRTVVFEGHGVEAAVIGAASDEGKEVEVKFNVAADAPTGRHDFRLVTANGVTNRIALDVVAGPVLDEATVTGTLKQFPIMISGRLSQPGETDAYWIEIAAGTTLTFEAISRVAGFDPGVALYEPSGSWFDAQRLNRIAFNDEALYFPGLSTNARLVHHFTRAGKYCVKVHGFNGEGGPERVYELRIVPGVTAAPNLHPDLKAIFEEREFTRMLALNWLKELARRGGAAPKEQTVETFHAVRADSTEIPIMTIPGVVEGRIEHPGDRDAIRVKIEKAQDIAFEVETPEATMPRFNPVVRVLEPGGREIATDVYTKLNNNGLYMMKMIRPKTTLSIAAPGEYTMQIRDITTDGGGPDFRYRVLLRPQIPHVGNVEIAQDHVNLRAGDSRPITVNIDREEGFRGYVTANVEDLPAGVMALPALENPEDKPPLPNGGRLERYTPREQRMTVMLLASPDATPSEVPARIHVIVRVIGEGGRAETIAVKEVPLMVLPGKTS
jgi:hypothetical protein